MKVEEYFKEGERGRISVFLYRYLGVSVALKLRNTSVTPNQLSVVGFTFGILAAIFFSIGSYLYLIIGTLVYQICIILDYSDGSLARFKNMTSSLGEWLEWTLDPVRELFVIFGICWGVYSYTGNAMVWILGFILCGTNFMMDIQTITFESFPFAKKGINSFTPKNKLYKVGTQFIGVRTIRYLAIIIFAITNQMFLFLAFFSIYNILVFLLMVFGFGKIVKQNEVALKNNDSG